MACTITFSGSNSTVNSLETIDTAAVKTQKTAKICLHVIRCDRSNVPNEEESFILISDEVDDTADYEDEDDQETAVESDDDDSYHCKEKAIECVYQTSINDSQSQYKVNCIYCWLV